MALFQSVSKSGSLTAAKGETEFEQFEAVPASGRCEAVDISLVGDNGKKYSMTLYGQELDQLREVLIVKTVKSVNLDIEKALTLLLTDCYLKEFEVIDGLSQHPSGINLYEWLRRREIISEEECARIQEQISNERQD